MRLRLGLLLLLLLVVVGGAARAQLVVFETDFESGLPLEFTAPGATVESVDGYAGLGDPGY